MATQQRKIGLVDRMRHEHKENEQNLLAEDRNLAKS